MSDGHPQRILRGDAALHFTKSRRRIFPIAMISDPSTECSFVRFSPVLLLLKLRQAEQECCGAPHRPFRGAENAIRRIVVSLDRELPMLPEEISAVKHKLQIIDGSHPVTELPCGLNSQRIPAEAHLTVRGRIDATVDEPETLEQSDRVHPVKAELGLTRRIREVEELHTG